MSDPVQIAAPFNTDDQPARPPAAAASLLRSARLIGMLTLVSRVLGLVRDMAMSNVFGAGTVSSAFGTAFQLPNLFRRLFGEGAVSAASIPVLTETLTRDGHKPTDRLAGRIMGLLLALLTVLCIVGEFVIAGLYWHFRSNEDSALVLTLSALMLPYMIFICAAAMLGGIQNVFDRFASAASAPIILNLFMIAATLTAAAFIPRKATDGDAALRQGIVLLSVAVVVSGIFQLAWQWAATRRVGLSLPLSLDTRDPAIRRIGITMLPMIVGLATIQINTMMDSLLAWWFVPEEFVPGLMTSERVGPSFLWYASRLYQFPLGVFASALATAIFPALSRYAGQKDFAGLSRTLSRGIRVASFEGLPCLVGLIAVREPLIRTIFAHGKFTDFPQAVDRVSMSLLMFSLGIWAFGINQIIVRAFYAMGDAKTPLWVSVRNVVLNLALNLILVRTSLKEAGLALSTSICAMLQVAVLLWRFDRRYARIEWSSTTVSIIRTLLASLVMGAAVVALDYATPSLRPTIRLGLMVTTGAATYLAAAFLLRCEELREMIRR